MCMHIHVIWKGGDMDATLKSFGLGFREKSGLNFHSIRHSYRNKLNITFQKEAAFYLLWIIFR